MRFPLFLILKFPFDLPASTVIPIHLRLFSLHPVQQQYTDGGRYSPDRVNRHSRLFKKDDDARHVPWMCGGASLYIHMCSLRLLQLISS